MTDVVTHEAGGKRLTIAAAAPLLSFLNLGSSVNINGVCLTVAAKDAKSFQVDVMPQSLLLTTIDDWDVGTQVNLEPSLRVGEEIGGHFLYGHVDGVVELLKREADGNAELYQFTVPKHLEHLLVPQGSVAIDGVSLTVVETKPFIVSLTPETRTRSTLGKRKPGDRLNIEIDMLIKYLQILNITTSP